MCRNRVGRMHRKRNASQRRRQTRRCRCHQANHRKNRRRPPGAASERFLVDLATPTRNTLVSATGPEQFFTLTERATPYNKGAATSWASHHPR